MARICTKWPHLLVAGQPVTEAQADDILLRTMGGYWFTNDRGWRRQVAAILGVPLDKHDDFDWRAVKAWCDDVASPDLNHLGNDRVMSSWIGGPKGWCDWDGTIGCGNYNIGKWPAIEEVEEDLAAIAAAWPFLDMRIQLVDDEEGDGPLCGEWRVWDGQWMETEPGPRIDAPALDVEAAALSLAFGLGVERGVSPERLASAWARVKGER